MLTTAVALAALTATNALALPASNPNLNPRSTNYGSFSLFATNVNNTASGIQPIHANDYGLYINRPTSTGCISSPNLNCSAFSNATILAASGNGALDMAVEVAGGQAVYVTECGDMDYTIQHSSYMPEGALTDLFAYTSDYGPNTFGSLSTVAPATGFLACPVGDGSLKIKVILDGNEYAEDCMDMTIATYVFEGVGAWEYE